ncbi:DUF899 family protein [Kribbella sp. NPDC000426]|uniref:DUF899 family protein n=1 Tax=Kribbella sp. NPDC000426 TaxID=3154255 RepID=UPI003317420D
MSGHVARATGPDAADGDRRSLRPTIRQHLRLTSVTRLTNVPDYHVTTDEAVAPVEYNYKDKATLVEKGSPWYASGEWQGVSVFLRDGDDVYHTYSAYERGIDLYSVTRRPGHHGGLATAL